MNKNYELFFPKKISDVFNILDKNPTCLLQAGGTDIVQLLKTQEIDTHGVIFLSSLEDKELINIELKNNMLEIGSMVTIDELSKNQDIIKHFPELAKTAEQIASPQIRFKATIGGNVLVDNRCIYYNQSDLNQNCHGKCFKADGDRCHLIKSATINDETVCRARFVSDLVPMLQVLGASLTLKSTESEREIQLKKFFNNDGISKNQLKGEELLTIIKIPLNDKLKIHYKKLRVREAIDFASLGVALALSNDSLKIGITGVDTMPLFKEFFIKDYENFSQLVEDAANRCMKSVTPLKQDFYPPAYRKKMVKVFIQQGYQEIS